MKIIGSVKEDLHIEKRVSITPETVKKFLDFNFSVFLEKNYGEHLGISDKEYASKGASFKNTAKEVLEKTEIILKVICPSNEEINCIKENSILIGQFDPFVNKIVLDNLRRKMLRFFLLIFFQELQGRNQWMFCLRRQI